MGSPWANAAFRVDQQQQQQAEDGPGAADARRLPDAAAEARAVAGGALAEADLDQADVLLPDGAGDLDQNVPDIDMNNLVGIGPRPGSDVSSEASTFASSDPINSGGDTSGRMAASARSPASNYSPPSTGSEPSVQSASTQHSTAARPNARAHRSSIESEAGSPTADPTTLSTVSSLYANDSLTSVGSEADDEDEEEDDDEVEEDEEGDENVDDPVHNVVHGQERSATQLSPVAEMLSQTPEDLGDRWLRMMSTKLLNTVTTLVDEAAHSSEGPLQPKQALDIDRSAVDNPDYSDVMAAFLMPDLSDEPANVDEAELKFTNCDVVIECSDRKTIAVNALAVSRCLRLRQAFAAPTAEARRRRLRLHDFDFGQMARFLRLYHDHQLGAAPASGRDLRELLLMLRMAGRLGCDALVDALARRCAHLANHETLVVVYHQVKAVQSVSTDAIQAQLWERIEAQFHQLLENRTYRLLTADEMRRLVTGRPNMAKTDEQAMVRGWLGYHARNVEERGCGWLRNYVHQEKACVRHTYAGGVPELLGATRRAHAVLLAVGGWGVRGPSTAVEAFDGHAEEWFVPAAAALALPRKRAYHAAVFAAARRKLYVVGGFDGKRYYDSTHAFALDRMAWESDVGRSLYENRCYITSTALDERYIMAIGGYNNRYRLDSTEIFDTVVEMWSPGPRLNRVRSDAGCVTLEGKVYVLGGFDGRACHHSAEVLDPALGRWSTLAARMMHSRCGVSAAAVHGVVMAIGGFSGKRRLDMVEMLDPREGKWHTLKPMHTPRSNFAAAVLRDQVVVAGGYDGLATTSQCERFDMAANRWQRLPPMAHCRSALAMCQLEGESVPHALLRPSDACSSRSTLSSLSA